MRPISPLKAHYLDDRKLAQLAWLEFTRAMRTRRVIAFVGSMATEGFGYPSWTDLVPSYLDHAALIIDALEGGEENIRRRDQKWAKEKLEELRRGRGAKKLSDVVAMSLAGEVLESERIRRWRAGRTAASSYSENPWPLDSAGQSHLERLTSEIATAFRQGSQPALDGSKIKDRMRRIDVPELLFNALDIRRFATTNYDFEIERKTMLRDQEWIDPDTGWALSPFDALRRVRDTYASTHTGEVFNWDLGSGRIRRVLTHGKAAESDLLNRERIDRLIEFAIGADDVDSHVMHLHGRSCDWRSMIVTQRDYDRLYRSNDLNRLPFEFARRLMMGGNPILFVGLGMSEADVNRELQEFISNNRYHRTAPAFLLWSAIPFALETHETASMRLDFLHRLGVLTIFDTDFTLDDPRQIALVKAAKIARAGKHTDASGGSDLLPRTEQLEALALSVAAVARQLRKAPREDHIANQWRDPGKLLARRRSVENATLQILWERAERGLDEPDQLKRSRQIAWWTPPSAVLNDARETPLLCIIGSTGCGKGHTSLALAENLAKDAPCLLINGSFSFDTDSLLSGIAEFFETYLNMARPLQTSRGVYFEKLATHAGLTVHVPDSKSEHPLLGKPERLHIVLNGAERFFSITGDPLSAELDRLMHLRIPRVTWTIFGTERLTAYMKKSLNARIERFEQYFPLAAEERRQSLVPFTYMQDIVDKVDKAAASAHDAMEQLSSGDWRVLKGEVDSFRAQSASRISGDSQRMREAFFTWALDGHVLAVLLGSYEDGADNKASREAVTFAQMILRVLCFFGLPVERAVLRKVAALREVSAANGGQDLDAALDTLVTRGLVLQLAGYSGYKNEDPDGNHRYALHRSLLSDLRSRFAIPLSEAKLSTAFNMSLYVAQPVDGYIPEPAIHDELGSLMDLLMGDYRDVDSDTAATLLRDVAAEHGLNLLEFGKWLTKAANDAETSEHPDKREDDAVRVRVHRLCRYDNVQSLRATLAVARGFYSTTGILTLDNGDRLVREDRDGILLEHAERLDRLIDMHAKTALARASLRESFGPRGDLFCAVYGEGESFYAEDLVWLHNERGVVRLAMGDLYEAKTSFERAVAVNRSHVEFDARDHNWRRIRLNQLTVAIEMGDIGLTRRMAEEIINVSREEREPNAAEQSQSPDQELDDPDAGSMRAEQGSDKPRLTLREDRLAVAIAQGHLGWCLHLQGEDDAAKRHYTAAVEILSKLEEVRAQAFFQRLLVDVGQSRYDPSKNREAIEKALSLVQATRQMDLVHRFQIRLAYAYFHSGEQTLIQKSYRMLEEALQYGLLADVHRVRCEASMTIARLRHHSGDLEGALRFASDALMIATRYGLELRKTTLRTDIARTMAARGHPVTAQRLAKTAVSVASRQRFHTAIDRAEQVLLEIPEISSAIRQSDSTGRRNF